jgi:colanic acid biosynthesis glycosyl transferase WcaI
MSVRPSFLIISQVYVPDPAAVGQHVADAAEAMATRGYRVLVFTSARGYEDNTRKYPIRERRNGVDIRRLRLSSFGKSSIAIRLIAQSSFILQAIMRGLFTPGLCGIMVSTSPPFCGFAGAVLSRIRRIPVKYWVMDLNPDQMVALQKIRETSLWARIFEMFNRMILRQASDVIVLDRFMLERVQRKGVDLTAKTFVIPPWPHEDKLESVPHDRNPFRHAHGLDGKFVFMYSGNHSPVNPIDTLLDAAERMQADRRTVFMFIGGGSGKKGVEARIARGVRNIRSLPYQPLREIKYSLSAADVHVVSVGERVVGIVHPSKAYGAMAVARPILLLGPRPCHVSELIDENRVGWHANHGDLEGVIRILRKILDMPEEELRAMGERAAQVVRRSLSKKILCGRFCDILCRGLPLPSIPPSA